MGEFYSLLLSQRKARDPKIIRRRIHDVCDLQFPFEGSKFLEPFGAKIGFQFLDGFFFGIFADDSNFFKSSDAALGLDIA